MRIAILQGPRVPGDTLARLDKAAADAAAEGADLLVCPEMFLTGYNIGPAAVAAGAETADGPSAGRIGEIARRHRIAIAYGYPEKGDAGQVFNSAQVFDAGGASLVNHRKCHLFGDLDRNAFDPGADLAPVFEVAGVKLGILICYDVEFPESVRRLALEGAEAVIVPTALMMPFDTIAKIVVPARAFENQLFIAYANRCGTEGALTYTGLSCIVGPDGIDRARAGRDEEMIVADIHPGEADSAREANPYLADRRPKLYKALVS